MKIVLKSRYLKLQLQKVILIAVFVISPFFSLAQVNIDSLKAVWNDKTQADSNRINAINDIIWTEYLYSQPDSAFYLAQQALVIATEKGLKKGTATLLSTQGVSFMVRGDYYNATKYHKRSLEIQKEINDLPGISKTYNNIALVSTKKGDYAKAIEYHNQSLLISEKIKDKLGIARALTNIATIYMRIENYDKSLEHHLRSLKICEELGNKYGISICNNNIGIIYSEKKEYSKALEYYFHALVIQEELGNDLALAHALGNIGRVYQLQGNSISAVYYQKRSLSIKEKIGNKEGIAGCLCNIAEIFQGTGNYDSAIVYSNASLKIATEIGSAINISAATEGLYIAYKAKGRYAKALNMFELFVEINDSLQSEEKQNEIIHQEYKYKYLQMHIADSLKNVQAFELEKINRQKEAERERIQRYAIYTLFGLILIVIGVILKVRSIKIRTEKEYLLKEIEILKSEAIIYMTSSNEAPLKAHLDRTKIDAAINGILNDSDWNVISLLCKNPTINNREISEQISLSFEGVRSSLKKMYRIFNIQNSNENQRIALVIQAIRFSNTK
ncbi:MAG: tetratricopeptide repeat protein [Bacteroidales bacterium]|nr:tetratricopeptide repeat protein [Bacteroidales bacterium]